MTTDIQDRARHAVANQHKYGGRIQHYITDSEGSTVLLIEADQSYRNQITNVVTLTDTTTRQSMDIDGETMVTWELPS